jgi:ubiquinone/menaquinone biosynthesis C-methylase UbiE
MKSIFFLVHDSEWYPSLLQPVRQHIIKDRNNKYVLDVGTGPGKLPELLIRADESLQITGVDISTPMIHEAQKRIKHENVFFVLQKRNAPLPFAANRFDVVTFCSVLFLLDASTRSYLLSEALRVLKRDGQIIVLTPSGLKPVLSAYQASWKFSVMRRHWTFIAWKIFTSGAGRAWQNEKWLVQHSKLMNVKYEHQWVFDNNASMEVLIK